MNQKDQELKKQHSSIVKVNKRLNKFTGVDLFPDKTARANKYGANVKIVEKTK